jgi:hypothetical protein
MTAYRNLDPAGPHLDESLDGRDIGPFNDALVP